MVKLLSLGAVLFALWVIFSTFLEPLYLSFGVLSVALSLYLARRLRLIDQHGFENTSALQLPRFWAWLGWQIIKSNLRVSRFAFARQLELKQNFVRVSATQKTEMGRAIFANSITLTPGTITVSAKGEDFLVHVLSAAPDDQSALEDMDVHVTAIEGRS